MAAKADLTCVQRNAEVRDGLLNATHRQGGCSSVHLKFHVVIDADGDGYTEGVVSNPVRPVEMPDPPLVRAEEATGKLEVGWTSIVKNNDRVLEEATSPILAREFRSNREHGWQRIAHLQQQKPRQCPASVPSDT